MAEANNNPNNGNPPSGGNANNGNPAASGTAPDGGDKSGDKFAEFFDKLDQILDKRSEGLAKSALKDNGVADDEIKDIVSAWKQNRQTKATESTAALTAAQTEAAALKAQIAQMAITTAAQTEAAKMGIDAASLPYVTKLADFTNVLNEKSEPDPAKISAALKTVIDDVPAFKKTADAKNGFVKVGGDGGGTGDEPDDALRRAFGLKPKQK